MRVLIIGQINAQGELDKSLYALMTAAQEFKEDVDLLLLGSHSEGVAKSLSSSLPIKQILYSTEAYLDAQLAEDLAAIIAKLCGHYRAILMDANSVGKDVLPRAAALSGCAQISDVIAINSACNQFTHPIYAGNILATEEVSSACVFLTIRSASYKAFEGIAENAATLVELTDIQPNPYTKWLENKFSQSLRPSLTEADVVIAGGRGLKSAENFQLIEQLADKFGGAVGATRAAVDAGYIANEYQVGQTGKIVAPKLYIAIGLSGAIQHIAGMKDSQLIIAINEDAEAPIVSIADYSVIGDLFEIVPALIGKI